MRRSRLRRLFATGAVAATLATGVIFAPAAANAETLHPAGCNAYITGTTWGNNNPCWLGRSYINYSMSVLAVQYVLQDKGFNPGAPDCTFGPNTAAATVRYQNDHSLSADGIAGPATLTSMHGNLVFSGIEGGYGPYYNVGTDGVRFYVESAIAGQWFVLSSTAHEYIAMGDEAEPYWCSNG